MPSAVSPVLPTTACRFCQLAPTRFIRKAPWRYYKVPYILLCIETTAVYLPAHRCALLLLHAPDCFRLPLAFMSRLTRLMQRCKRSSLLAHRHRPSLGGVPSPCPPDQRAQTERNGGQGREKERKRRVETGSTSNLPSARGGSKSRQLTRVAITQRLKPQGKLKHPTT